MKRHLNLMSNRSSARESIRKRFRQWTIVLALVNALLVPTWFLLWWPVHQESQRVVALNAKFEPSRQMNRASKRFQSDIERVRAQEKTALSLAKIDTPVVTLLGMVSKTVADSHGTVVIENMDFHQRAAVLSEHESERGIDSQTFLEVVGRGMDEKSVKQLANHLRTALPSANVEIKSSKPDLIHQQQTQKFTIQCSF